MTREDLERLWKDPAHWRGFGLGIYGCARDPRLIVPKRERWAGWTVNVAHAWRAWIALLAMVVIAAGPYAIVTAVGPQGAVARLATAAAGVGAAVALSHWESTRPRT